MRRLALLACTAALALAPAAADAAIVPGATVDGPSAASPRTASSRRRGPDGTVAIAYLKARGVRTVRSRASVDGAWTRPTGRTASPGASGPPRIVVANGGKVVVTFANGG